MANTRISTFHSEWRGESAAQGAAVCVMWLSTVCILLCSRVAQGIESNRRSLQGNAFKTTKNLKRSDVRGATFKWTENTTSIVKVLSIVLEKNVHTTLGQSQTSQHADLITCLQRVLEPPPHVDYALLLITVRRWNNGLEDGSRGSTPSAIHYYCTEWW